MLVSANRTLGQLMKVQKYPYRHFEIRVASKVVEHALVCHPGVSDSSARDCRRQLVIENQALFEQQTDQEMDKLERIIISTPALLEGERRKMLGSECSIVCQRSMVVYVPMPFTNQSWTRRVVNLCLDP